MLNTWDWLKMPHITQQIFSSFPKSNHSDRSNKVSIRPYAYHKNRVVDGSNPFAMRSITMLLVRLENYETKTTSGQQTKEVKPDTHPVSNKHFTSNGNSHIDGHAYMLLLRIENQVQTPVYLLPSILFQFRFKSS